jgi:hypothetical protein
MEQPYHRAHPRLAAPVLVVVHTVSERLRVWCGGALAPEAVPTNPNQFVQLRSRSEREDASSPSSHAAPAGAPRPSMSMKET